jgi:hypothetical protein
MDGGPSQDAAAAGSGGGAGGTAGGSAGAGGGTVSPSICPVRNLRLDLLSAFGNLNERICDVCFDAESTCPAAPFGGNAIECFIDVACNTPHLVRPAMCLTGALASEHGLCNQGAEASCADDCYLHALGKAVVKCDDPNLGLALSKCGFNLTI